MSNRTVANNCGPMKPRGVAWNRAGVWLIFSQSRQVNFSHRLDYVEAARDLLQRLGHILADRRQPRFTAADTARWGLNDDTLAFDVMWPWFAYRPFARQGADVLRLRRCGLRGKLVLARRGGEFFEPQLQLLEQPGGALGALPAKVRV